MKRTDVAFSLAFSTAMSMAASEASKDGKPAETIKKLVVLSLKAGSAFVAGTGLTPEIEQLAQDAELVKLTKEEDQTVADAIELLEKMAVPVVYKDAMSISKKFDQDDEGIRKAAIAALLAKGFSQSEIDSMAA